MLINETNTITLSVSFPFSNDLDGVFATMRHQWACECLLILSDYCCYCCTCLNTNDSCSSSTSFYYDHQRARHPHNQRRIGMKLQVIGCN